MEDILQLLPHRPPFVMVDSITTYTGGASAGFTISEDNVLVRDGLFSESGLIENMAQAAGAGMPRPEDGSAPSVGYIGAIKELAIHKLPGVGTQILTKISYLNQVLNVHLAHAEVQDPSGELIASCELKIFLQPN
ncbi:MAG: 3-hydroxyacyl-ACP dehydratase [Bacteroidetes bacterium]|nr:3-hydroxyacyl-ACP dehydratase [Bacteroidota bacterium]MBS1628609.1 3-hydroxyacyl-ACP dehydratase [Bacteroidota bacterium]